MKEIRQKIKNNWNKSSSSNNRRRWRRRRRNIVDLIKLYFWKYRSIYKSERTYKCRNSWAMSVINSQKKRQETVKTKKTSNLLVGLALEIKNSFLILTKAKYFCSIINPLLTRLFRSRWLNTSLFFSMSMVLDFASKNKNSGNIRSSWPHAWSITLI